MFQNGRNDLQNFFGFFLHPVHEALKEYAGAVFKMIHHSWWFNYVNKTNK